MPPPNNSPETSRATTSTPDINTRGIFPGIYHERAEQCITNICRMCPQG
jgi:hypothetical protein